MQKMEKSGNVGYCAFFHKNYKSNMDRQGNKDGECKGIGNLMAILKTEIHISSIGEEIDLYGSAERI